MQVLGLDHVVLRVADIDESLSWYERVLDGRLERSLPEFGLYQLRIGAALIDLVPVNSKLGRAGGGAVQPDGRNLDHFAVQLASFNETELRRHLEEAGVTPTNVERRYGAEGYGPSMYLRDPDGNVVELKGPPDDDQT